MLLSYKLSNFCGCVYKNGNIIFDQKKNFLFSPVGNRITIFDLEANSTFTLDCQTRSDIYRIAKSPTKNLLVAVDKDGYAIIINLSSRTIVNQLNLKDKINDVQFSPDGNFLALVSEKNIKIYEAPGMEKSIEPLVLFKKYHGGHSSEIKTLSWSPDSRFILTTSEDNTVRLSSVFHIEEFTPITFTGHKAPVVRAFFSDDMAYVYTISKDGLLNIWKWVEDYVNKGYETITQYQKFKSGKKIQLAPNKGKTVFNEDDNEKDLDEEKYYSEFEKKIKHGRFILQKKQQFQQSGSKISCADYHISAHLFIIGFKNGVFGLYKLSQDEITPLQTLSITEEKIGFVAFNYTGNWIGFCCAKSGQLMVWEWRSQTYILNQQGLYYEVTAIEYSPNGNVLATGGTDGKIKLWDTNTYLCFATFSEHSSKVTGLRFVQQSQNTLVSCSLDGTCRGYDTVRYRNFRTMVPETSVQLTCLAVDPLGEIVCAGSSDPYLIYCWSLQTGNLVDIISGHEGPITCLSFSPQGNMLASGSWDKTVRITDIYGKGSAQSLTHNSEVLDVSFRPDGREVCTTTLKGELYLWDPEEGQVRGVIDGRRDISGGRCEGDKFSAKNSKTNKHFKSICYSADGEYVLAGGNSKYICLYHLRLRILLKKYVLTNNRSLDGILQKLNTKNIKDGTNINEIQEESGSDLEDRKDNLLPGAKTPNYMKRNVKLKIDVKGVKFSPSGKAWSAATTEGVAIFSYDDLQHFAPAELNEDVSLEGIKKLYQSKEYYRCLMAALQIDDRKILEIIYQNIPTNKISSICQGMPEGYIERFMSFLASMIEKLPGIEFNLKWLENLLFYHPDYFKKLNMMTLSMLRNILKSIHQRSDIISNLAYENIYTLEYISNVLRKTKQKREAQENMEQSNQIDEE